MKWALAENLKYLRKKYGMGQEEVASKLGVTQSSVSAHEVGKSLPTVEVLEKLSALYGFSMDDLLKTDLTITDEATSDNIYNQVGELKRKIEELKLTIGLHQKLLELLMGQK